MEGTKHTFKIGDLVVHKSRQPEYGPVYLVRAVGRMNFGTHETDYILLARDDGGLGGCGAPADEFLPHNWPHYPNSKR